MEIIIAIIAKYLFLTIGAICIISSVVGLIKHFINQRKYTVCTDANVVDVKKPVSGKTYVNFPVVEYYVEGELIKSRDKRATNKIYAEGQKIEIKYNPNNCKEFTIVGVKSSIIVELMGILLGAIFIGVNISMLLQ